MKLWKTLKRMKTVKAEKIKEHIIYEEKLDKAKSKVVEFMVADIQKQMNAHLANKFKNLAGAKAKKKKGHVGPLSTLKLDTIAEEPSNLDDLIGHEEGNNFQTPLGKKVLAGKKSLVKNINPQEQIDEADENKELDDQDVFKLAKERQLGVNKRFGAGLQDRFKNKKPKK